jgi:hypothetical protein
VSTKVYEAYRLKRGVKYESWLPKAYLRALRGAQAKILELSANLAADRCDAIQAMDYYKVPKECNAYPHIVGQEQWTPTQGGDCLKLLYGAQLLSPARGPWDLNVSIRFWQHKRRWYLIPYCDGQMRRCLRFLKSDPGLEDYAYWNNVDMPEGMTRAEWKARGRTWDALDNLPATYLDIVSWDGWFKVSPLATALSKRRPR